MSFSPTSNSRYPKGSIRIKNIFFGTGIILILVVLVKLFNFSAPSSVDDNTFSATYRVLPVPLPDSMNFAGETVPMNRLGVRENLDQEILSNTYWQSQTMLILKRANRYLPVIEKILHENEIPADFKYLAMAESGFNYRASPAGAVGFWQQLKTTAQSDGLEVNQEVDERNNLEKSTVAACKYLKESYEHFHNWTLVAASYNMGMGGVAKALQFQKQTNYYDLWLNTETSRYVFRILAFKELQSHPDRYGFYLKSSDFYPVIPTIQITVDSSIDNLANFAICQRVNYRTLKMLNPWLVSNKLVNPDKKTYTISLPRTDVPIVDLGENIVFNDTGKCINSKVMDTATLLQYNGGAKIRVHFVDNGETMQSIAALYHVTVQQLCEWNSLSDTSKLRFNDEIMLFPSKK